jgi:hypothetical protein
LRVLQALNERLGLERIATGEFGRRSVGFRGLAVEMGADRERVNAENRVGMTQEVRISKVIKRIVMINYKV